MARTNEPCVATGQFLCRDRVWSRPGVSMSRQSIYVSRQSLAFCREFMSQQSVFRSRQSLVGPGVSCCDRVGNRGEALCRDRVNLCHDKVGRVGRNSVATEDCMSRRSEPRQRRFVNAR